MTTPNSLRSRIRRLCDLMKTAEPEVAEMLRCDLTVLSATIRAATDEMLEIVEQIPLVPTKIEMARMRPVNELYRHVEMQVEEIEARARTILTTRDQRKAGAVAPANRTL